MKKFILFLLIIFPVMCLGYTNFSGPPEDTSGFLNWFFASMPTAGSGWMIITAFAMTVVIGILKLTKLKTFFDKFGNWKFLLVMFIGAVVELIMNLPSPFTWSGFLNIIATGALGTGSISIAFHHVINGFTDKK